MDFNLKMTWNRVKSPYLLKRHHCGPSPNGSATHHLSCQETSQREHLKWARQPLRCQI